MINLKCTKQGLCERMQDLLQFGRVVRQGGLLLLKVGDEIGDYPASEILEFCPYCGRRLQGIFEKQT